MALRPLAAGTGPVSARQQRREHPWCAGTSAGGQGSLVGLAGSRYRPREGPEG